MYLVCVYHFLDKRWLSDEVMLRQTPERNKNNPRGWGMAWGTSQQRAQPMQRSYIKGQV